MKIGIEVNGVLRDTLSKIEQVYSKFYLENPLISNEEKEQYKILSPIESLNFKFLDAISLPKIFPMPKFFLAPFLILNTRHFVEQGT